MECGASLNVTAHLTRTQRCTTNQFTMKKSMHSRGCSWSKKAAVSGCSARSSMFHAARTRVHVPFRSCVARSKVECVRECHTPPSW